AYLKTCRRGFVLRYFGDPAARAHCAGCDNCLGTHVDVSRTSASSRQRSQSKKTLKTSREASASAGDEIALGPADGALLQQLRATREMVRQFARDEVAPTAAHWDAEGKFPWENIKKMGELGLLGVPWPEELGGAGLDTISFMIVIEELAKVDASHALTVSAHTTLGTSPIVRFGNDEQRRRFVPWLASGRVMGGFGLTEPEAGSDAGGTRTTAIRKNGYYVLNGVKRFITHGSVGEIFVVTAVTDRSQGTKGISSFVLTKETSDIASARRVGVGDEPTLP